MIERECVCLMVYLSCGRSGWIGFKEGRMGDEGVGYVRTVIA